MEETEPKTYATDEYVEPEEGTGLPEEGGEGESPQEEGESPGGEESGSEESQSLREGLPGAPPGQGEPEG